MGCQREGPAPRRIRLTDQALVGVAVARRTAEAAGRSATSADLLVGLGVEPDGWAGHQLRRRGSALAALAERVASPPPGLTSAEAVVAAAADRAGARPPGTADLLAALPFAGGHDLGDLLAACGFSDGDLAPEDWDVDDSDWAAGVERLWGAASETVTLPDAAPPLLDAAAARVVGRVRAVAGGAVDLVLAIAAGEDAADLVGLPAVTALTAARRAVAADADAPDWDLGIDAVVRAARVLAGAGPAGVGALLHAALVAGGRGPLALVEAARAPADPDETEHP
jgi:hypothetical protein